MPTIFTRIIQGEIPCYKIAENEHFIAFLDINPVAPGHTLVVPKVEIDYVFDVSDEVLSQLLPFAKRVARAIDQATGCIRTGMIVEGLEVPHAHLHLIPMYPDRKGFSLGRSVPQTKEQMEAMAASIRAKVTL
jgi:histidine triad (HIT) family protein